MAWHEIGKDRNPDYFFKIKTNLRMISFAKIDLQKLPYTKILLVAVTIIAIMAIRSCSLKELEVTSSGVKIKMYEAQATVFETTVNTLGEKVATQAAVITNKDKEVQALLAKNSTLSTLASQVIFASEAKVTNVMAPFIKPDTIHSKDTVYIPVGTEFSKVDQWYSISGSVQETGLKIDSLKFTDSTTYNLGTKKSPGLAGYFKPYEPTLEVISHNPYVTAKSLQNMKFVSKPKWWEHKGVWFVGGIVTAGTGIYFISRK